jgi:hypothetical protein
MQANIKKSFFFVENFEISRTSPLTSLLVEKSTNELEKNSFNTFPPTTTHDKQLSFNSSTKNSGIPRISPPTTELAEKSPNSPHKPTMNNHTLLKDPNNCLESMNSRPLELAGDGFDKSSNELGIPRIPPLATDSAEKTTSDCYERGCKIRRLNVAQGWVPTESSVDLTPEFTTCHPRGSDTNNHPTVNQLPRPMATRVSGRRPFSPRPLDTPPPLPLVIPWHSKSDPLSLPLAISTSTGTEILCAATIYMDFALERSYPLDHPPWIEYDAPSTESSLGPLNTLSNDDSYSEPDSSSDESVDPESSNWIDTSDSSPSDEPADPTSSNGSDSSESLLNTVSGTPPPPSQAASSPTDPHDNDNADSPLVSPIQQDDLESSDSSHTSSTDTSERSLPPFVGHCMIDDVCLVVLHNDFGFSPIVSHPTYSMLDNILRSSLVEPLLSERNVEGFLF